LHLFFSNEPPPPHIYTLSLHDALPISRLTDNTTDDSYPSWSPDGSKIAFESNRDGNYEIYEMNADGSDQKRITDNGANDQFAERSEEHTSELQSQSNLVCRLLLEKKKK